MAMKKFSLWLQEEVNSDNIEETLNKFYCQNQKLDSDDYLMVKDLVNNLLSRNLKLEDIIADKNISVSITDHIDLKVHAMYNPNDQTITINKNWYEFLMKHMSEDMAYTFIVSHEVSHSLEEDSFFKEFKRRKRNSALELMSLLYSKEYSKVDYHPFLYEYYYGIENGFYSKEDLVEYLKGN